ncbi:MAG: hypothetical protein ACRDSZ_03035 [Pseudonocardiaceae bacterium]
MPLQASGSNTIFMLDPLDTFEDPDDAFGYVEREQLAWKTWLESLDSVAAHR